MITKIPDFKTICLASFCTHFAGTMENIIVNEDGGRRHAHALYVI